MRNPKIIESQYFYTSCIPVKGKIIESTSNDKLEILDLDFDNRINTNPIFIDHLPNSIAIKKQPEINKEGNEEDINYGYRSYLSKIVCTRHYLTTQLEQIHIEPKSEIGRVLSIEEVYRDDLVKAEESTKRENEYKKKRLRKIEIKIPEEPKPKRKKELESETETDSDSESNESDFTDNKKLKKGLKNAVSRKQKGEEKQIELPKKTLKEENPIQTEKSNVKAKL